MKHQLDGVTVNPRTYEMLKKLVPPAPPVEARDCKNCLAPVPPHADHISAGDCRAAQRKVIKSLRAENERLRGVVKEREQMASGPTAGEPARPKRPMRTWAQEYDQMPVPIPTPKKLREVMQPSDPVQPRNRTDHVTLRFNRARMAGLCTCHFGRQDDYFRGTRCVKHG